MGHFKIEENIIVQLLLSAVCELVSAGSEYFTLSAMKLRRPYESWITLNISATVSPSRNTTLCSSL